MKRFGQFLLARRLVSDTGLRAALAQQRETIVLRLHADMKFRQIAELQEVPVKTVQSRYRYGLDKLRSLLNGEIST